MNATVPLISVVNADRATLGLLREWLGEAGYRVVDGDEQTEQAALTIVDVPFTRRGGLELLQRVSVQDPAVPVLALSATFFSNVRCGGDCARVLGVAGVLPKPLARAALLEAVDGLLRPAR
jgi:DNA-binding response OmpR family regulator